MRTRDFCLAMPMAAAAAAASFATFPASAQPGGQVPYENAKAVAFSTGTCAFRLNGAAPVPCNASVMFVTLKTGRSFFMFTKEDAFFSFSGGRDSQPNLENYTLSLDRVRFGMGERGTEGPVEGECKVRMTRKGKFQNIQCDAYNRANGLSWDFSLKNIKKMESRAF